MKTFIQGKTDEPALWGHVQALDGKGRLWKHGRAWLSWRRNSAGIEWTLFPWRVRFNLTCSDTDDYNLTIGLSLLLFSVWLHVARFPLVCRLPGVKWTGKWGSGEREIRITFMDGGLWWVLWRYPNESKSHDWRDGNFKPLDLLLGRERYSEGERYHFDTFVVMPEAVYPVTVELYRATWKRPRWPWGKSIRRADIECEKGVPKPGKGENSWDMEDDALFGMTCPAATLDEARTAFEFAVLSDRLRYGGSAEWKPA